MTILISTCVYLAETIVFRAKHIYLTKEEKKKYINERYYSVYSLIREINIISFLGNASLLLQSDECNTGRHPLLANNLQDGGADSDTNSHCALILEESTPTSANNHNNCTSASREKSNGNNNYEMREFNRRLLLSNGASPGTGVTVTNSQSKRT